MADLQSPPTYAEVVLVDPITNQARFNPIWLRWFIDLAQTINTGGGVTLDHEALSGLLGGGASDHYHLTQAQRDALAIYLTGVFTTVRVGTILRPPKDNATQQTNTALYGGNGAPSNVNGANGDFYFRGDGAAGTFIYHKAAGAWVAFA